MNYHCEYWVYLYNESINNILLGKAVDYTCTHRAWKGNREKKKIQPIVKCGGSVTCCDLAKQKTTKYYCAGLVRRIQKRERELIQLLNELDGLKERCYLDLSKIKLPEIIKEETNESKI